ncbi:MAG: hypothetical protein ACOYKM_13550 [Caulobacterales bacterium]|jgi:hypothetical protein
MMDVAGVIGAIGCSIGAAMGLRALFDPRWAGWLVRLRDDPNRLGGAGEFRGTYGGLFFFTHALGLATIVNGPLDLPIAVDGFLSVAGVGVLATCGLIWWGTAVGRLVSIFADRSGLGFNWASVGFEIVLGAMVLAPLIFPVFA